MHSPGGLGGTDSSQAPLTRSKSCPNLSSSSAQTLAEQVLGPAHSWPTLRDTTELSSRAVSALAPAAPPPSATEPPAAPPPSATEPPAPAAPAAPAATEPPAEPPPAATAAKSPPSPKEGGRKVKRKKHHHESPSSSGSSKGAASMGSQSSLNSDTSDNTRAAQEHRDLQLAVLLQSKLNQEFEKELEQGGGQGGEQELAALLTAVGQRGHQGYLGSSASQEGPGPSGFQQSPGTDFVVNMSAGLSNMDGLHDHVRQHSRPAGNMLFARFQEQGSRVVDLELHDGEQMEYIAEDGTRYIIRCEQQAGCSSWSCSKKEYWLITILADGTQVSNVRLQSASFVENPEVREHRIVRLSLGQEQHFDLSVTGGVVTATSVTVNDKGLCGVQYVAEDPNVDSRYGTFVGILPGSTIPLPLALVEVDFDEWNSHCHSLLTFFRSLIGILTNASKDQACDLRTALHLLAASGVSAGLMVICEKLANDAQQAAGLMTASFTGGEAEGMILPVTLMCAAMMSFGGSALKDGILLQSRGTAAQRNQAIGIAWCIETFIAQMLTGFVITFGLAYLAGQNFGKSLLDSVIPPVLGNGVFACGTQALLLKKGYSKTCAVVAYLLLRIFAYRGIAIATQSATSHFFLGQTPTLGDIYSSLIAQVLNEMSVGVVIGGTYAAGGMRLLDGREEQLRATAMQSGVPLTPLNQARLAISMGLDAAPASVGSAVMRYLRRLCSPFWASLTCCPDWLYQAITSVCAERDDNGVRQEGRSAEHARYHAGSGAGSGSGSGSGSGAGAADDDDDDYDDAQVSLHFDNSSSRSSRTSVHSDPNSAAARLSRGPLGIAAVAAAGTTSSSSALVDTHQPPDNDGEDNGETFHDSLEHLPSEGEEAKILLEQRQVTKPE